MGELGRFSMLFVRAIKLSKMMNELNYFMSCHVRKKRSKLIAW